MWKHSGNLQTQPCPATFGADFRIWSCFQAVLDFAKIRFAFTTTKEKKPTKQTKPALWLRGNILISPELNYASNTYLFYISTPPSIYTELQL